MHMRREDNSRSIEANLSMLQAAFFLSPWSSAIGRNKPWCAPPCTLMYIEIASASSTVINLEIEMPNCAGSEWLQICSVLLVGITTTYTDLVGRGMKATGIMARA